MEVKTKYNIGDAVYILEGYKIHCVNIVGVFFQQMGASPKSIQYKFAIYPTKKEGECFRTKEELIKFLSK